MGAYLLGGKYPIDALFLKNDFELLKKKNFKKKRNNHQRYAWRPFLNMRPCILAFLAQGQFQVQFKVCKLPSTLQVSPEVYSICPKKNKSVPSRLIGIITSLLGANWTPTGSSGLAWSFWRPEGNTWTFFSVGSHLFAGCRSSLCFFRVLSDDVFPPTAEFTATAAIKTG